MSQFIVKVTFHWCGTCSWPDRETEVYGPFSSEPEAQAWAEKKGIQDWEDGYCGGSYAEWSVDAIKSPEAKLLS